MCDQKESVVLHRREKKLVVMLAADGRYGARCVCVYLCVCVCICVYVCVFVCGCICVCTVALNSLNVFNNRT